MSTAPALPDPAIPRGAFWFAGAVVVTTMLAAASVRLGLIPVAASPEAVRASAHLAPVASRDLVFTDRADGGVIVTEAASGSIVDTILPGSHSGFIRGIMRALARERRMDGIGRATPFRLTSWRDGELSLTDLATKRSIELPAFGTTNRAAFAALLPSGGVLK